MKHYQPVVTPWLSRLLDVVLLLFALLAVNSVYPAAVTALEAFTGAIYQDYFYLLMFLPRLLLGLLVTVPVILFVAVHLPCALRRPHCNAIRAGHASRPEPARTVAWYSALIDRQNGHLESAIETLENIAATRYSEARQRGFDFASDTRVLNEMGRALYERARQLRGKDGGVAVEPLLARAQYWLAQAPAIDPEYAAAHHNLSRVARQQGDPDRAEQRRLLHERYRPDGSAVEQAVTRHRSSNAAADHAAAELAIYSLTRPDDTHTIPTRQGLDCRGDQT